MYFHTAVISNKDSFSKILGSMGDLTEVIALGFNLMKST